MTYMSRLEYSELVKNAQKEGVNIWEMTKELVEKRGYEIEGFKEFKRGLVESKVQDDIKIKQESSKTVAWWMKNAVGWALDSVTGLPKLVFKGLTSGIANITEELWADKLANKMRSASQEIAETDIWQDKDSLLYKGTKLVGDIAQTARLWGMLWQTTWVTLPAWGGLVKQVALWAIWGVRDAYIYDMVANSEIASGKEVKMSAIVGWALPIVGKIISWLGSKLYQSAFRGVKKSLDEESVARYWYRAWKLIEDESLNSYTISWLKKETGENLKNTWEVLFDSAKKTKPVSIDTLKKSLKTDITKKLTEWLPASANKDAITSNVDEIVDFYIGDWVSLQWQEAVSLIKNMNSQIPDSLFKKSANVLDPSKTSTVMRQMKDWLQKFLNKQDETITALYWDYSRNKLIEEVLENIEVKKALWREIIGAVAWGSLYGREDLKEWNIGAWIAKALVWAIIGWAILRTSGNPDVLSAGGKLLKQWGGNIWPGTQKYVQPILSEDDDTDEE